MTKLGTSAARCVACRHMRTSSGVQYRTSRAVPYTDQRMVRGSLFAFASLCWIALPSTASADGPEASGEASGDASAKVGGKKKNKKKGKKTASADASASTEPKPVEGKGAAMKKRVGFGAIRTLSSTNGLFVNGYLANRITIGAAFGVATFTHRETDDNGEFNQTRTVGRIGIGPEIFFFPMQGDRNNQVYADFGFGARFMTFVGFLGADEDEMGNTLDTPLEFDIELPAKIGLWIGQRVAIMPEFGVAFRIVPGSREADANGEVDNNPGQGVAADLGTTNGPGFGFEFGDHAGFFMGIGLGYYFGKI